MANDVVLNPGVGGATAATDDIGGVHHQKVKMEFGPENSATQVSLTDPLPVDIPLTSAKTVAATAAALAAGGVTDLDSAQIASGTTGQLAGFHMGASVPLKGELKTVLNAVETSIDVFFSPAGETKMFNFPSKRFIVQAESATAGFDGFRLTVTNLDTGEAADVYAGFLYDEE